MEKKDPQKYKSFDSSSETSSVASDTSLDDAGGPDFADFAKQLQYEKTPNYSNSNYFSPYENTLVNKSDQSFLFPSTFLEKQEAPKTTEVGAIFAPKTSDLTTIFLIDSLNRDKKAFPQPTTFTLKLPRLYRNVKSISMTQIKLLCSFYYFSDKNSKSNIYLPIREKGRDAIAQYNGSPLTKVITIRQGTYGINDLLNEIQTEMNYTPLFYDFPGGFSDFIKLFTVNGDYSLNFNQPGDTYYDSLNNKYIQNPTLLSIVLYYWGSRYAGLSDYTVDQVKVAYYYPVLYEVLLDDNDITAKPFIDINDIPSDYITEGETAYSHLIFNMSGINDRVALFLINKYINYLDIYRLNHTFRYSLVNRYQLSYDTNSLQVNITTITLNTSLVNLINNTASSALTSVLTSLGITVAGYETLQATINKTKVVYASMYQFLQKQLTTYVGIPFAKYSPQFFNNIDNSIYFQNGLNAIGVRSGYTSEYLTSGEVPIVSSVTTYSDSPGYWPQINTSNNIIIYNTEELVPYDISARNFQFSDSILDYRTYYFNTIKSVRGIDTVIDISAGKYSVIKFRSSARQTLQVETLPLPYYYRYADYNKTGNYLGILDTDKNNVPQKYFDISYNFIDNTSYDNSNYSTVKLTSVFGQSFSDTYNSSSNYTINSQSNYSQFEFISPYPPNISSGLYATNTSLSFVSVVNNISTLFPDSFTAFLYHDRAAFMADINTDFQRKENPLHYIKTVSVNPSKSDLTINFSTFSGHKYYVIFRSNNLACSNTIYKPIINTSSLSTLITVPDYTTFDPQANPYNTSNLASYPFVTNYNSDFTRLPTQSSLMGLDPDNSTFNLLLSLKGIPIGYDTLGVSNDLTDYLGYTIGQSGINPTSQIRVDPLSFYNFKYISPFDTIQGTYFNSTSSNSILTPVSNNNYIFKGTSTSQVKIVHWYQGYSIPQQLDDPFTKFTTISTATTSNITDYIKSYPIKNSNITLGRGVNAIGFLPSDGEFDVSSFSFKSSIYPLSSINTTSEDPNLQIKYVGVFSGLTMANNLITLSSAITLLKFKNSVAYGASANTSARTPGYKYELGTWYTFEKDPDFISEQNYKIGGYTPGSNDLLSYNSMYYMVPFSSDGLNLTYSVLSGSLVAYPLAYNPSTTNNIYGQTSQNTTGSDPQLEYIFPVEKNTFNSNYGPQGINSPIQSQYANSIPITTTSIGYKDYNLLVNDTNAPFSFSTFLQTYNNSLTTFVSEYSDNLYLVNASSINCSNALLSYPSANHASSLSTVINNGNTECMNYLLNTPSTLQNYSINGEIIRFSTFGFKDQGIGNSNITTHSFEITPEMKNVTMWLWGGGGGTSLNSGSISGGAGAYVKVEINVETLLSENISTLHMVVGKGGNRDNTTLITTAASLQLYEQPRYGGGGTSILGKYDTKDSLGLQGGGFSGIFTDSNVMTATPLIIVGGGGAAGVNELGGPGGFGVPQEPLTTTFFYFTTVISEGVYYRPMQIQSVIDNFNNTIINNSTIQNVIDGSLTTLWNPSFPAKLNPTNYIPTPNTYGVSLQFSSIPISTNKIRYYGPNINNSVNLPTGFILYNDINKTQILYSNTSIGLKDFQEFNNGTFTQNIYDIYPSEQVVPSTIQSSAWLVVGKNTNSKNSIQYSLNKSIWVPTQNSSLTTYTSIQYIPLFSKWYATGQTIMSSLDGITWTPCSVSGFNGTQFNTIIFGLNMILAGGNNGTIVRSTDGINFSNILNTGTTFPNSVLRIRFINNIFWAIANTSVRTSINGTTWSNIVSLAYTGINDITYGLGRYIIAQQNNVIPFNIALIYSLNGNDWLPCSSVNITGFTANSVMYANNVFVAVGKTTDGSSFIKYSSDGVNWQNSKYPSSGDIQRNDIQYLGNTFISTGKPDVGLAGNQSSIITSVDGISWSYSLSGGFDASLGDTTVQGNSVGYGTITVIPNLSTLYLEIQAGSNQPYVYGLKTYDTEISIPEDTLPALIDNDLNTIYYPGENNTVDVIEYPFVVSFDSEVPLVNKIQVYVENDIGSQFTGITVNLDTPDNPRIYTDLNVSFEYVASIGKNYYEILLVPEIKNVSSLNITFIKNTLGSIKIARINVAYDENEDVLDIPVKTITDIDNRIPFRNLSIYNLSKTTDNNINTYWQLDTFTPGIPLRLNIKFNSSIDCINYIQLYNGPFPSVQASLITSINIYTNSTKSTLIYSNSNLVFEEYYNISMLGFYIPPLLGYSDIYIELGKTTPGSPLINELKFYYIGRINDNLEDTLNGYSAGNTITSIRDISAINSYNGGGGSSNAGGYGGTFAYTGNKYLGGSSAISDEQKTLSTTISINNAAGGGGGGYYGGGGGGLNNLVGSGGGGGSGFIINNIFNVLDYGVASPGFNSTIQNYISPGSDEQADLINKNIIKSQKVLYGQGGNSLYDSGKGGHGIIIIQYSVDGLIEPPLMSDNVYPSFVDGSQLIVYKAPINYYTGNRSLSFSTFQESIETTKYAGYNWIWYRSFLSLVGLSLTTDMVASSTIAVQPTGEWPNLPFSIYTSLSDYLDDVIDLFENGMTSSKISNIISSIDTIFTSFQNIFIQISYSDASYKEMTEIYCLLDYLRNTTNLSQPHAASGSLERLLGGIPRFGYWANPFLTNVSYIGFDITSGQIPTSNLSTITKNSEPVQAIYGLVLEQSLLTGTYTFKDIMAYKPNELDVITWQVATQFSQSYVVRSLTNDRYLELNTPVQPYTFKNAISARLPLFKYNVYTIPTTINSNIYNIPIQVLNDFEGKSSAYSFQNNSIEDISTIHLTELPFTSTTIQMNQKNIDKYTISYTPIIGTAVSENINTTVFAITSFGLDAGYKPFLSTTTDYYNTFNPNSPPEISNTNVGKAITDIYGNYFFTKNDGSSTLYENISTTQIYAKAFSNTNLNYASSRYILSQYNSNSIPANDFFFSKYTNIWHIPANGILNNIYGARLTSVYDFNMVTRFANQIFYPTHKITLVKTGTLVNPIKNTGDTQKYPSFQRTQMFFYNNYTNMAIDIDGKFAQEKKSNFTSSDTFSGYDFNSYMYNINLQKSSSYDSGNPDGFNYLAIRAYSPSETFKTLVRFYLPQRYDFGYIRLKDLSNELQYINTEAVSNVNPDYKSFLAFFNNIFSTTQTYGNTGVPGFSGSNITTTGFGDFLKQFNSINTLNQVNISKISTIEGFKKESLTNLISGDLKYILPSYLANRNRTTDPVEFMIPFSTCVTPSNANVEQYGMGYNLGFAFADTKYNTLQRATSFFKLLDDSIFLRMNQEFGMNKMDISQPENFAQTRDTTAQSGLYNSKLMLNSFGSFATTFVQSPVTFNPPIGKLETLSFSWYNSSGVILNNADCEWSGSVQIVELVNAPA